MRKIYLYALLSLFFSFNVNATQLVVDGDHHMTGDESYSDNVGTGIYADGTTGTIYTNGNDLTANGNEDYGVYVGNDGKISIEGDGSKLWQYR